MMISRREWMMAASAVAVRAQAAGPKKVIVAGGGIGGLCCAYELMQRGHEVTVLEASGRVGGHVRTVRDGLADGLYVDAGAYPHPIACEPSTQVAGGVDDAG